ncbi:MAG: hypothetical protein JRN10_02215 [Nitrososphaerota archaeon]|nr:hypothetical protein [Nitrososphaerota archaeon]
MNRPIRSTSFPSRTTEPGEANGNASAKARGKRYFTTLDLTTIALFSALQFILQYYAGRITFIPGAERPIVAFPVAFMATVTYLRVKKIGAVGITALVTGILVTALSGFVPVIFEWAGAALGFELTLIIARLVRRKPAGIGITALASAMLMLGRGIGVTIGLLIFVPAAVFSRISTATLLSVYIAFNGIIPPIIALLGAYAAAKVMKSRGLTKWGEG